MMALLLDWIGFERERERDWAQDQRLGSVPLVSWIGLAKDK